MLKNWVKCVAVGIVILSTLTLSSTEAGDLQWDELKFTQEWGYTACRQFKDKSTVSERKCRFEGKPSIWSIHGIWPTKVGTEGPNFCNKVTFDVNALTPIMSELQQYWYEIDETKVANHFWEHEWVKHGSCAMELDTFGTELKYFGEGLSLRSKLDLYSIFKTGGGIVPRLEKGYMLQDFHSAFQKAVGSSTAVPYLQCLKVKGDAQDHQYHLLAVEICLDKDLTILDCSKKHPKVVSGDQLQDVGDAAQPCPKDVPILYEDYLQKPNKNYAKPSIEEKNSLWNRKPSKSPYMPMIMSSNLKYWKELIMQLKLRDILSNLIDS